MGYVYLLKSNKKDTLKIGMTTNLEQRMKSFKTCSRHLGIEDETFEFLYTVKVDKYAKLETLLHKKFADKRVCGEWFDITKEEFVDTLESIDLDQFKETKTIETNNKVPIIIDNYILVSALFKNNAYNYNHNVRDQLALDPWIEGIDHKYYNDSLYINIEEIPFLLYDGIWYMMKSYYQKRFFNEFVLYPILDILHLILNYSEIVNLFKCDVDEEALLDIENWRAR